MPAPSDDTPQDTNTPHTTDLFDAAERRVLDLVARKMGAGMRTPQWPADFTQRALREARARLGQAEVGGKNRGPIVEEVADPFLSDERLDDGLRTGILNWCAFFCSFCYLAACESDEQRRAWRRLASGQCSRLWERLEAAGWTWVQREPAPAGEQHEGAGPTGQWTPTTRLPRPGAVLFLAHPSSVSDSNPHGLVHVELVDRLDGDVLWSVGGNTGPKSDSVAENHRSLTQPSPRSGRYVFGFAEPPA